MRLARQLERLACSGACDSSRLPIGCRRERHGRDPRRSRLQLPRPDRRVPRRPRHRRPRQRRHLDLHEADRAHHPRPGLREHRGHEAARSPTSTATPASCATAATRSRISPRTRPTSRSPGCSSTASCPRASELEEFDEKVRRHTLLHEDLKRFFYALPHTAHPMSVLSSRGLGALDLLRGLARPARPREGRDLDDPPAREAAGDRGLRAQEGARPGVPLPRQLARASSRTSSSSTSATWPSCTRSTRCSSKALDRLLILHEDHEQNASTSTVRLVGSTEANMFASISAGINALYGPLHGGANEAVLTMLADIRDSGESVQQVRRAGEEQGRRHPAHGLRPPGLQELRPARARS